MSDMEKARQLIDEVDCQMADLFEQRMDAVCRVAEYKRQQGLPIEDLSREKQLIANNMALIENKRYRPYYVRFQQSLMAASKALQHSLSEELTIVTSQGQYPVILRRGGLHHVGECFHLNRKVLVVTDSGVPDEYVMTVASQCEEAIIFVFDQGEVSKTMATCEGILQMLVDCAFTRADCIVAVGGGVAGDMAGLAASLYMRGIDFYNVPTTLLAQADASVGGKTAVNFAGYKNLVGAFYPPKGVLIDADVLETLPQRQISNGIAEIIKMAVTFDAQLFERLENGTGIMEDNIRSALSIKQRIVEEDERESHLRKALNFGHTLGHAIESVSQDYLHGECVALGMLPMCAPVVRKRLEAVLSQWDLPLVYDQSVDAIIDACRHDKKTAADEIAAVYVPRIGSYEIRMMPFVDFEKQVREVMGQ